MFNSDLTMYRSASMGSNSNVFANLPNGDKKKKKKKTMAERLNELSARDKKYRPNGDQGNGNSQQNNSTSGNVFHSLTKSFTPLKQLRRRTLTPLEQQNLKAGKSMDAKQNNSSKDSPLKNALQTGNAKDAIDQKSLKVNKIYQKKVNKILGG